jgi:hypothetical protein
VCPSNPCVEYVNIDTRAVGGIAVDPIERPLTLIDPIETPVVFGMGSVDWLLGVHPQDGVGLNPPNPRALSDVRKFFCIEIRNDKIKGTFGLGANIDAGGIEMVRNDVDGAVTVDYDDVHATCLRGRNLG